MEIVPLPFETPLAVPLQSHPGFAAALQAVGRAAQVLALSDGGRVIGQLVLIRRRIAGCVDLTATVRGPVWSADATPAIRVQALRRLRRAGLTLVESDAADPALHAAGFRQVMTAAHVAELDLTGSRADRIAALLPAWRNALRKAERSRIDVVIRPYDGDPGHWLLRQEAAQRRIRRYHALPSGLTAAYARANPGQAILFQAEAASAPIAAMLMLRHGAVATYQIGWTGPQGRSTAAHQLLLMDAADWLAARGVARLDLGAVDTETNPGLADFKIGSGARVRPLGGSWLAVPGL